MKYKVKDVYEYHIHFNLNAQNQVVPPTCALRRGLDLRHKFL